MASNSSPPVVVSACLSWAENLDNLLNDTEGLKLFRSFLAQDYVTHPLDFYLACVGLRKSMSTDSERLRLILKSLYRKYLRSNSQCFVPLSDDTRHCLQQQIAAPGLENWLEAVERSQGEVKTLLKRSLYQQFLKSDVYLHHLQQFFPGETAAVKTETPSLPTLREDHELKPEDCAVLHQATPSSSFVASDVEFQHSLTDSSIGAYRQRWHERRHQKQISSSNGGGGGCVNKKRQQHLAVFDNALPHPPSSTSLATKMNGSLSNNHNHSIGSSTSLRVLYPHPAQNNDASLRYQPFIPRGERPSKWSNLAQENPLEFARILAGKLSKVIADREKEERVERCLRECAANNNEVVSIEATTTTTAVSQSMSVSVGSQKQRSSAKISSSLAKFVQSLSSEADDDTADEHAQSILEDHMSRIWDRTLCLDAVPPSHTTFPDSNNAFSRSFHLTPTTRARRALNPEILSVSSYDSGAVHQQFVPPPPPPPQPSVFGNQRSQHKQILIDPTGHFDSGISIADTESAKSLPPLSTTAKQKVLNWMLHNDQKPPPVPALLLDQQLMPPPPAPLPLNVTRSNDGVETSSSSTVNHNNHSVHEYTTVAYKFSDEEIPYRSQLPGKNVTLRQFKQLITKRGLFRFYFKHATDEFPGGCVNEEVVDDDTVLPLYDGKIFARVERIEASVMS